MGQILEGFDAVDFTGAQKGIYHGSMLGSSMRACEQIVFPPQGNGPYAIFDQVIQTFG